MDRKHCVGCEQDFYNGKNSLGVKVCWHLKDAKLVMRKRVGMWETPPWQRTPERLPNCYQETGYIFVDPKVRA
jgi:hypothetical protein